MFNILQNEEKCQKLDFLGPKVPFVISGSTSRESGRRNTTFSRANFQTRAILKEYHKTGAKNSKGKSHQFHASTPPPIKNLSQHLSHCNCRGFGEWFVTSRPSLNAASIEGPGGSKTIESMFYLDFVLNSVIREIFDGEGRLNTRVTTHLDEQKHALIHPQEQQRHQNLLRDSRKLLCFIFAVGGSFLRVLWFRCAR